MNANGKRDGTLKSSRAGIAEDAQPARRRVRPRWSTIGLAASGGSQIVLTILGILFFLTDDPAASALILAAWCFCGSVYLGSVAVVLGVSAKHEQKVPARPDGSAISRPARIVAFSGSILASLVGAGAAIQLGITRTDPIYGPVTTLFGIWAMLLAWALLQWGFTQLYFLWFHSAEARMLEFPATPHPRLVEFAYFAFTIATTFATSDVSVLTSAGRWRVTLHSIVCFFFNGLIVVFAFSTIANPSG